MMLAKVIEMAKYALTRRTDNEGNYPIDFIVWFKEFPSHVDAITSAGNQMGEDFNWELINIDTLQVWSGWEEFDDEFSHTWVFENTQ
jgi:hypothetical protein